MAQQIIDVGNVANDGQGDPLRTAFIKTNDNFTELYNAGGVSGIQNGTSNITIAEDSTINMAVAGVPDVVVVSDTDVTVSGMLISNTITSLGNIYSNYYLGNGSLLSGLNSQNANSLTGTTLASSVINSNLTKVGILNNLSVLGNINSSGNLNLTSNIHAGNITSDGFLSVGQGASFGYGITSGGTISATGNIVGNNIIGTFVLSSLSTAGNVTGGNILTSGVVSATSGTFSGSVSAAGNVTGNYILGNGSLLTGVAASYGNSNVATYLPTYTGALAGATLSLSSNVLSPINSTNDITTTANITGNYFTGNGSQLTGIVATEIGTLTSLSVSGSIVAGSLSSVGSLYTGSIYGGSLSLVGTVQSPLISASDISTTANVLTGNLTAYGNMVVLGEVDIYGNISNTYSVSASYFYGGAVELENHVWVGSVGNSIWTSGNVTGANILSTGLVSAITVVSSSTITAGNILTGGIVSATSNITGGNIFTAGIVSATSDIVGGNISTGGVVSATSDIVGGNISTGGVISATGNIATSGYFLGTFFGNITGNIVVPGANTQVLYNNNGNIGASAGFLFDESSNSMSSQNIYADYFYGDGSNLTGIVATNIGVLPSLSVTGNIDTGNLIGNVFGGDISTDGTISTSGDVVAGNINSTTLSLSGNVQSDINSELNITTTADINSGNVYSYGFYGNSVEVEGHVWVGSVGNSIWTSGNVTGDNIIGNVIISNDIISATGNINTSAEINTSNVYSFGFYGNSVEVEDHVWVGGTGNSVWTAGNVTGNNIIGSSFVGAGAGTPTLSSATNLDLSAAAAVRVIGGGTFRLPSMTSTQRDTLTAVNGDLIYNTTLNKIQGYENGGWGNLI